MWVELGFFVASLVIGYLFRPKTTYESPKPGKIEVKATAAAGGEIPVLFGCREITGQNIVWWGDRKTKAIKKSGGKK